MFPSLVWTTSWGWMGEVHTSKGSFLGMDNHVVGNILEKNGTCSLATYFSSSKTSIFWENVIHGCAVKMVWGLKTNHLHCCIF